MKQPVQKILQHTILLAASVGFSYLWNNSSTLNPFNLQIIALSIICYVLIQYLSRKSNFPANKKSAIDIFILTLVIYLIIFSTGALFSPLFFLIYFLLFGISLILEPSAGFILAIISTIFFLASPRKELWAEFLQLASLFLISPLSLIFGTQYIKVLQDEEKIKVLSTEGKALQVEVEIQEEEVKSWTKGEFRSRLIKIWESLDALLTDSTLTKDTKQRLQTISKDLSKLLESGQQMEKKIEE